MEMSSFCSSSNCLSITREFALMKRLQESMRKNKDFAGFLTEILVGKPKWLMAC
jgi:hypothetical protein